jgi:hypothetical protein
MTLKVEVVVDGGMHAEEALGRSSRFEALDLALSSSYHLVGVLGPMKLPRFRGVELDLGDYGSVVTASIAAS